MALAFVVAAMLPLRPGTAQIANCDAAMREVPGSLPDGVVFKLLLDELSLAGVPDAIDPELLAQSLRLKLLDNVRKIGLELESVHVVVCLGRKPVNPTDVQPSAPRFVENDVVLEVWGFYDGDEVVFTNAVMPLLAPGDGGWAGASPFYHDSFAYDGQQPHLRFLKQIVQDSVQLRAYAAVGIATRSLIRDDFDRARRFFCRAQFLLAVEDRAADPTWQQLATFVNDMSVQVIDLAMAARTAGRYAGRLGTAQLPSGTPCEIPTS